MRMHHRACFGLVLGVLGLSGPLALSGCGSSAPVGLAPIPSVPALPDPERFEAAVVEFEAADASDFPLPGGILCIGSSSMRMWHPTLARDLAPLRVIPRGFGGSTWLDLIHYTDRLVLPYRPRAIVLYEGDNDIDFGATPEEALALFSSFVARVRHSLPSVRLYVLAAKPSPARWSRWPAMARLNSLVSSYCDSDPRSWYVDVATPMLGEDGQPLESIFLEDRLHMNAAGYEIWTSVLQREVVQREFE